MSKIKIQTANIGFREVEYLGNRLMVPDYTSYVAYDADGRVHAFSLRPHLDFVEARWEKDKSDRDAPLVGQIDDMPSEFDIGVNLNARYNQYNLLDSGDLEKFVIEIADNRHSDRQARSLLRDVLYKVAVKVLDRESQINKRLKRSKRRPGEWTNSVREV